MLVADLAQATRLGGRPTTARRRLAERFWPGAPDPGASPRSTGTQAYRAPDHPVALDADPGRRADLRDERERSDEPDTLGADEVLIAFATQQDELAAVVDGGAVPGGVASTVLDLTAAPARILREGPISREQLAEVARVTAT